MSDISQDVSADNDATGVVIKTSSAEATFALGGTIGQRLEQPLALLLYGDLGSGKTAFAQGLAAGLDVPSSVPITSPTYTLINEYPGRLRFYHVDLYRLPEPIDPDDIGLHELLDDAGVIAIEWAPAPASRGSSPLPTGLYFRSCR